MNLPRLSVRNPVAVNLLMLAVLTTGAYSWFALVREFFPNLESEQILITVPYPGATPEEVEKSVTRLIEREIEDVEDIKRVESKVYEGLTLISAELEEDADRDRVLSELRSDLDRVKPNLPEGAEEPEITEARPQIPVIAVVLYGRVAERVLHDAVLDVRDDLLDLPQVTEVTVTGFRDREILVEILPEKLEGFGISFAEVGRAISSTNLDLPGGQLKGLRTNIRVRTLGEQQIAARLEDIVVRTGADGSLVRLRDVAVIRDGFEDRVERGRFLDLRNRAEGTPLPTAEEIAESRAASITVFKTPEQDAIEIAGAVKAFVAGLEPPAGGAVQVAITTDLARFIEQRLDLMKRNAGMGLLLVLLTLAIFLELRIAFWVAVGLLVSFAGTFLLMGLAGATINLISLFGLIVVLGLIVDDAIVIGENIFTKLRAGVPPLVAAEQGATEVAAPVVAAVLTTIAAFIPLALIEGRIGSMLGVLPVVVICALSFSLVEAFFILPAHLRHLPPRPRTALGRAYARFNEAKHRLFEQILPGILERQLRFILRWRYAAAALSFTLLLSAAGLLIGGVVPFVLLQDTDAETATARLETAAGTPEEETLRMLGVAERATGAHPEVATVFTVIGSAFGDHGPEVAADPATLGQMVIELVPADARQAVGMGTSQKLLAELRRETAGLPGVKRLSWQGRSGGPAGADIEVLVRGEDMATVQQAVAHVTGLLASYDGVDEIYDDLQLGKLEARLRLRAAGRLLGLTTRDLAVQVRHALFGFEAQDLQIGDEEVTVRAVLPEAARRSLDDLLRLRVVTPAGRRVPLDEVARMETTRGYASLSRVDGKRAVTITAEVDEDAANVRDVTEALRADVADIGKTYAGVSVTFEGRRKETSESLGSLAVGFPAALLAIFTIIAIIFRSYTQPVIVMIVIPYALVGAVLGHFVMGYPFTILSMIGAVALSGIVVNDGLILVDYANRERRAGVGALEAVLGAARARLRPILLTSITTIAGLAPIMLETSFQAQFLIPMAVSIVFGLAFATALTLLLLPVFYMIFEDVRMGLRWIWTDRYTDTLETLPEAGAALPDGGTLE